MTRYQKKIQLAVFEADKILELSERFKITMTNVITDRVEIVTYIEKFGGTLQQKDGN